MILSGLDEADNLEIHTLDDAVVLLKDSMTADEILSAIESLNELTSELITHLVQACGRCDGCTRERPVGDVPPGLLPTLSQCGVCMSRLDDLLAGDKVIYGGT
jgi:hypothetical protein